MVEIECPGPFTDKTDKGKVLSVLSVPTRGDFLLGRAACPTFWKDMRRIRLGADMTQTVRWLEMARRHFSDGL
jgi:hypothetical protein